MYLTYDEYDTAEEICERILEKNENEFVGTDQYFPAHHNWPTVEQMEELDVEKHFEEYFPFLFFYYTQRFDEKIGGDMDRYQEYKDSVNYIKRLMERNIVFIDDE